MSTPSEKKGLFDRILAQSRGHLLYIARQYAPPGESADLYQEIMYRLLKNCGKYKGRSAPATWTYRVAVNTAIAYKRDNLRRDMAWRAYGKNVQCEMKGGRGEAEILREFTLSLPKDERLLFALYMTKMGYAELAELAGMSEPALRAKISLLRKQYEQRYL